MSSLFIDRRNFLKSAGSVFLLGLATRQAVALAHANAIFASAYQLPNGTFGIATLTERGEIIHKYDLPSRGHDIAWHPSQKIAAAFARRPGTFAAIIDVSSTELPKIITAAEGRHFYGHGAYSRDGKWLYATENDYDNARGVIGVYNVLDDYKRVGEFEANGVGPHELELLADGETLVIANGGIETHPDFARTKLNIPTMKPNLSFIDRHTGALKGSFALPPDLHKLSIRHIAVHNDVVWFACQNQGDITTPQSLIGSVDFSSGEQKMLELPDTINASLRGYVGSIAHLPLNNQLGFTSPVGGVAHIYDLPSGTVTISINEPDVCGLAPAAAMNFITSAGGGQFGVHKSDVNWDNHIARIKS